MWTWVMAACVVAVGTQPVAAEDSKKADAAPVGSNWPQFRGDHSRGQGDGTPPTSWNVETGEHVKWKTPIPGLAHSSPIVWGDRLFVTTAVSDNPEPYLRVGLYGESPDNPEDVDHDFRVYCLDKMTGKVLWQKTAHRGKPTIQRHIKSTHANSTPATDGTHVVAFFGSEGLYGYDMEGTLLWKKDLGLLDAGAFNAPEIRWGFGSSPIIHDGKVFVQCDVNNQSFVAAFDVKTGEEIWRTLRDEGPCWGTPAVAESAGRTQVILNGYRHIGGYDAATGKELWRMRGGGDVPVPTPVVADDLVYITNAHGAMAPLYAVRTSAKGDITLTGDEESNEHIAWSYRKRGNYMQTPLVYGKHLYMCRDNGVMTCFDAGSGKKQYNVRLGKGLTGFSASPVAAGGKVYFTSEQGDIHVLRAGSKLERLATNAMGEVCMATPAISGGRLYVRTQHHVFCLEE